MRLVSIELVEIISKQVKYVQIRHTAVEIIQLSFFLIQGSTAPSLHPILITANAALNELSPTFRERYPNRSVGHPSRQGDALRGRDGPSSKLFPKPTRKPQEG
jgi:hypothetical protein